MLKRIIKHMFKSDNQSERAKKHNKRSYEEFKKTITKKICLK